MAKKSLTVSRVLLLLAVSAPAIAQSQPASQSGASAAAPPSTVGQGFSLDPKYGQTPEQQWTDRYACHNWSKSQSGYDPTRQGGGVPPDEAASRRDQYRRAMTACLEARGYGVRYAAPAPPPAAAPVPVAPPPPPPMRHAEFPSYSPPPAELKYHPFEMHIDGGYTLTVGALKQALDDGGNVGLGFTWFPTSALPLGIRVDGSYSRFTETQQSRYQASIATGTNVAFGHQDVYGGDVDAQLDLAHRSSRFKMYLFGGFGRYREQTVFKQVQYEQGAICGFFYCSPGYIGVVSTVERTTSPWIKSWNAGFGMEVALADPVSFFLEGEYLRLAPYGSNLAFIPIRLGLRF